MQGAADPPYVLVFGHDIRSLNCDVLLAVEPPVVKFVPVAWLTASRPSHNRPECQRIRNQIDAVFIFAWPNFVKVRRTLRVAGACEFKYLVAWSG